MPAKLLTAPLLADDPLWFKDAIIYEVHVRSFCDSSGDGIGDFRGLIEKLDYLQDLGVNALWLLPFYPSPLRDDGYDIADYTDVNPAYGSLRDFKLFLKEAHARGIRVITELVINHTSSEHAWFQRARRAPAGSAHREFYVWSDTPDRYSDARIIFQDFETSNWTWDPVAGAYYWHRFYAHQPDLNFRNPHVEKAVLKALDFWMELGVDGMRLDAVPYLYEAEGTNCENLPETHAFLKRLRRHVDRRYKNRVFLAEANQWPEDAAAYFGAGDECHMNFHFPLMPRMFMAVQLESVHPIHDILEQTPPIPDNCQWAVFLRNHDELTLEMVTDEDRDYMYHVYAADPSARVNVGIRRRLSPLLQSRRKVELLNALLFSLPGTPVLYYGDEIGMGDNVYLGDRDGVRTPMQWSGDRNAGFSRANPQRLYLPVIIDPEYHCETVNVEAQQRNPASLLWWMKRLIGLRKEYQVFGRGDVTFLRPENHKVLAFVRSDGAQTILVVANLSRYAQFVELPLTAYRGYVPMELFGHTLFPPIAETPYMLTLGPHSFYWFSLEAPEAAARSTMPTEELALPCTQAIDSLFVGKGASRMAKVLSRYALDQPWFLDRARRVRSVSMVDWMPLGGEGTSPTILLVMLEFRFAEGTPQTYVLAVTMLSGDAARTFSSQYGHAVIATLNPAEGDRGGDHPCLLVDALLTEAFARVLVSALAKRRRPKWASGKLAVLPNVDVAAFPPIAQHAGDLTPRQLGREHQNTTVSYGEQLVVKLFRRSERGLHPEAEMGHWLGCRLGVDFVPPLLGTVAYDATDGGTAATIAVIQRYVANQGSGWDVFLGLVDRFYEQVAVRLPDEAPPSDWALSFAALVSQPLPQALTDLLATAVPLTQTLALRLGQLHVALASETRQAAFAPEPYSQLYQRSIYQTAYQRLRRAEEQVQRQLGRLSPVGQEKGRLFLQQREVLDQRLRRVVSRKLAAKRIRFHGHCHLGQVLYTGRDFVFLDFEGDPRRTLSERRFKMTALRDVASLLSSLHYAACWGLRLGHLRPEDIEVLLPWADRWYLAVASVFLQIYLPTVQEARLLPADPSDLMTLLEFCMIDRCLDELAYELAQESDWINVPLDGLSLLVQLGG